MKYILRPFGLGAKNLLSFSVDTNCSSSIVLGRNHETGLDTATENVQHVSRSHVCITVGGGHVNVQAVARQDRVVHMNGFPMSRQPRPLVLNDEISLLGSLCCFNYRLELDNEDQSPRRTHSATTATYISSRKRRRADEMIDLITDEPHLPSPKTPTANLVAVDLTSPQLEFELELQPLPVPIVSVSASVPEPTLSSSATSNSCSMVDLLRQYECEICYDVIANACTLIPCGDVFCFSCIADWSAKKDVCPHCQGNFALCQSMPNKMIDNAIRETLKLDGDQLQAWEKRASQGLQRRKELFQPVNSGVVASFAPASSSSSSLVATAPGISGAKRKARRTKPLSKPPQMVDLTQ
jgi:hypothetical protein